ncbi:Cyclin-dependent kinase C-1 [Hibiscus syriacus]|uniref:Cyclin-dependent kinase C-1 n=1 Tax=Hibiscus syriacus TaxID=106335 RepID=A0A6A3CWN4_HIBSY|nr:Cyclin-dependent kinase C-1 [Hibiscus syriacus]
MEYVVTQHPGMGSLPKATEGEQVAAGWPTWLASVAGEAIRGWVPRRADSLRSWIKHTNISFTSTDMPSLSVTSGCVVVNYDDIGQGTYSNVYRARDLDQKKIVALKKLVPCFEYMEHDLAGLASHQGLKFSEPQVKCYMQQLLCGLDHCHSHGVLHRDIKGSNLLIDNNGILKIADFGLASSYDPHQSQPLTSRVVTLWYRPPELLLGATYYGTAVDLWSTGCILAELYAGKPIMPGRLRCCVAETFKEFPAPALALMETLLSIDPADRGSAASALKSKEINKRVSSHAPDANAELVLSMQKRQGQPNSKSRSEKFNPHPEEVASGFPIDPPRPSQAVESNADAQGIVTREPPIQGHWLTELHGRSLVAARRSNLISEDRRERTGSSQPEAPKVFARFPGSFKEASEYFQQDMERNVQQKEDGRSNIKDQVVLGYGSKGHKIHYSGPLLVPSGNMDQMLKDHDRQIQEAVRRARLDKAKMKRVPIEGSQKSTNSLFVSGR